MPTSTQFPAEIYTFPGFLSRNLGCGLITLDGNNEGKLSQNITPASNDDTTCAATVTHVDMSSYVTFLQR
jgi:hypothetical protein